MLVEDRAVALIVLVEDDAVLIVGKHMGQRAHALFERLAPQILAVVLDQIEGAQHGRLIVAPERSSKVESATLVDHDRFAVDEAGPEPASVLTASTMRRKRSAKS